MKFRFFLKTFFRLNLLVVFTVPLFGTLCFADKPDPSKDPTLFAVAWQQTSGEAKALYYQGYKMARYRLAQILFEHDYKKAPAVVLDLDETVLDNSPFQVNLLREGKTFSPEEWMKWSKKGTAKILPGVREFIDFAKGHGLAIFYVSNRYTQDIDMTWRNLKRYGVDIPKDRILLKDLNGGTSAKDPRRNQIAQNFDIVLLIGDNLGDFADFFQVDNQKKRDRLVEQNRKLFGERFIILPNPMYGNWVDAITGKSAHGRGGRPDLNKGLTGH